MNSKPLLIEALNGRKTSRPPIWFMRQAGRFLPEYRRVRAKHSMLEVIKTAELAAAVTLQPIERFGFDAAVIFADILNPLIGMGIDLDFIEGRGPVIANPIKDPCDVVRLRIPPVEENVGYTLEAIRLCVSQLQAKAIPLIGFCGAPFTLSAYLIEGKSSPTLPKVKGFMWSYQESWHELQTKLTSMLSDYLIAQARSGAAALQIFDSWLGALGPSDYLRFVHPHLCSLVQSVKKHVDVPIIFFSTGTAGLFPYFRDLGVDALSVDWRISLGQANALLGSKFPLQGNLDPALLLGPWREIQKAAARILVEGRELTSHIFNLGHGILPETPVESVHRLVEYVRTCSE